MSTGGLAEMIAAARKRERAGDLAGAVRELQQALGAAPGSIDALTGLARVAQRLGDPVSALELWAHVLAQAPSRLEAVIGRAHGLAELGEEAQASAGLCAALDAAPNEARLWDALGRIANQQGDRPAALAHFEAAVRLDPRSTAALYNRGGVRLDGGDLAGAEKDFTAARGRARTPADIAMAELAVAMTQLCRGHLEAGWRGYEARLAQERPAAPQFDVPGRRWRPAADLAGKHLLVVGEQGIGDQILFANPLVDVAAAMGGDGALSIAVDPRLVTLFQRSFAGAQVLPLQTERVGGRPHHRVAAPRRLVDVWTPMASLPQKFRSALGDFPQEGGFLIPDPGRVAHWRSWLSGAGPSVGISWRSRKAAAERRRRYPRLEDWEPVLRIPGARFVNLQYGVEAQELADLAALRGAAVLEPPGLDLFNDIDDLAALCLALDAVVSVPNATAALAGAVGAHVLFLDAEAAWPRLGTGGYPWYPGARSFPLCGDDWSQAMADVAAALKDLPAEP